MNRTMFRTPMIAAPPNTMPAVTGALAVPPGIVVYVSLILSMTPAPSRTPNKTPTTINQTKKSAIDRTQENFRTVQGLMCRSCRRARRGPRPRPAECADPVRGAVVEAPTGGAVRGAAADGAPAPSVGTAAVGASGEATCPIPSPDGEGEEDGQAPPDDDR